MTSSSIECARISVAMATYNGEKYIREQLDSIARQRVQPLELVITDDGSTDATLQVVDEFAGSAPFAVRVFRNETRLGYGDNFLKAASLCQGDLIALCDQDDIWMEEKLSVCSQFFGDPAVMLAIHSARTIARSGVASRYFPHFSATKVLKASTCDPLAFRPGFAMMIRKDLLYIADNNHRPHGILGHDHWLSFLAISSGRVVGIADVLTLYRQHESNLVGAPKKPPAAKRVRYIIGTTKYDQVADTELACSLILRIAAGKHPDRADRLRRAAGKLEIRSRLHRIRTDIYKKEARFVHRALAFSRILFSGGYWPDRSRTRLGIRSAMKDALFGVPGTYKFFASENHS